MAYPKIDPDLKRKWVSALRSGRYTQVSHKLRHGDSFCCIGVLCDILPNREWSITGQVTLASGETGYEFAPVTLLGQFTQNELSRLNLVYDFSTIATWIEANL